MWDRLEAGDRDLILQFLTDALAGSLVTNQIVPVQVPSRDEPLPVLLNFVPVHLPTISAPTAGPTIQAVMITGEVLAEPTSWTVSQTQRHRLETLGRMTMGITHEFNNLLSGVLGYTELLKGFTVSGSRLPMLSDEPIQAVYADHLRTIEQAAQDGAVLIKKLQRYIRQEKQTRFERIDLPSLVHDCIAFTRPYWYNEPRRQGIHIELVKEVRDVPPVSGLATELREVLVNLILNAIQAMPEGGTLRILLDFDDQHGIVLTLSDTGIGMSETVRQRIFEPLFTTKGKRGTGMGLAVSYGIVQEHDGTIDVQSELGKGTTFRLSFPPAPDVQPPREQRQNDGMSQPARVLVVDDESMVRTVLSKLLTLRGHTVHSAASGPEALDLVARETVDVVVADQAMPEMSGRVLAKVLSTRYPSLPIVLLTGDTDVGEPGGGIARILTKPFRIDEIDATIQDLVYA